MPMTKQKAERIATIIDSHFPDAVDIHMVGSDNVIEIGPPQPTEKYQIGGVILNLKEVEPETGIFAAMSPVTHDVYVYLADEAIA